MVPARSLNGLNHSRSPVAEPHLPRHLPEVRSGRPETLLARVGAMSTTFALAGKIGGRPRRTLSRRRLGAGQFRLRAAPTAGVRSFKLADMTTGAGMLVPQLR